MAVQGAEPSRATWKQLHRRGKSVGLERGAFPVELAPGVVNDDAEWISIHSPALRFCSQPPLPRVRCVQFWVWVQMDCGTAAFPWSQGIMIRIMTVRPAGSSGVSFARVGGIPGFSGCLA